MKVRNRAKMKVYIVSINGSGSIEKVFDSQEKASAWIKSQSYPNDYEVIVEDVE